MTSEYDTASYKICVPLLYSQNNYLYPENYLNTLLMLKKCNVPKELIYIFVIETEHENFTKNFPDYINYTIITVASDVRNGWSYINNCMSDITSYFEEGSHLLIISNDRITGFTSENSNYKSFHACIEKGFELCEEYKCKLWGYSGNTNNTVTIGLQYIPTRLFGIINDKSIKYDNTKSNDDCILQNWLQFGNSIRLNFCYPRTLGSYGKVKKIKELETVKISNGWYLLSYLYRL
jgi:hypothetical protein